MNLNLILSLTWLLVGCKALPHETSYSEPAAYLTRAQQNLDTGDYYQARKLTSKVLEDNPEDHDAQKLMAEILNREIAWQKEVLQAKTPEEYSNQELDQEARTWLERSRSFMDVKQYDQAYAAAEKVFVYDPENIEASKLMDEIRSKMLEEGSKESWIASQMRQDEVHERIERYRREAKRAIAQDLWGTAKHAIEKILLLLPDDPEALRLQDLVKAQLVQEGS